MENSKMFSVNGCDFIFCKHNVINSLREYEPKYDLMIYDGWLPTWRIISHPRNITEAKKNAKSYTELGYIS